MCSCGSCHCISSSSVNLLSERSSACSSGSCQLLGSVVNWLEERYSFCSFGSCQGHFSVYNSISGSRFGGPNFCTLAYWKTLERAQGKNQGLVVYSLLRGDAGVDQQASYACCEFRGVGTKSRLRQECLKTLQI